MLVVMTYNAYFTIAVVGGAGLGYYFFALFDLPSKVLGTYSSTPTNRCTNPAQGPEGNSYSVHNSYGTSGNVPSSVVLRPSSELEQFSRNNDSMDLAFENSRGEPDDSQRVSGQGAQIVEVEKLLGENCEGRNPVDVDVSDTAKLLPQETIKVEVQVHAYPEE